ncbi:hypothetical protein MMB17_09080 [Methylobacterium organophilum]|uniref:hypothetical protein n=1 Tax=Methylobacterium organophilum TaxID=410 RepID=UPI001F13E91E|nr:hypothetical protein [Methylobacterium organophilum]UMY19427.1 hypothetical protein MMB17_09080 [Methylobacterium organophilum]
MKTWILGVALAAALTSSAYARNFAVPNGNPAVTIVVPDDWKIKEIDYGYSAKSPDSAVMFYVEYAKGKKLDAMINLNKDWMAENEIDGSVKPEEREMDFNGTKGQVLRYNTTDSQGKTIVDFVLLEGGGGNVVMLTLWGSQEERAANSEAISGIMKSVRPIR